MYLATLSPESRRTLSGCLRRITGDAPGFPWTSLDHEHVVGVRASLLDEGMAPATVNKHLSALKGVLRTCWRMGLIPLEHYQRAADVPGARGGSMPAGRVLTDAEVRVLYERSPERDRRLLDLLYGCGLRRAEAARAQVDDLDSQSDQLWLRVAGKGGKQRRIPVPDQAAARLARRADSGPLLDPHLTASGIYERIRALATRIGLPSFGPHDLRRTYATRLYRVSRDIETVCALMGHASTDTTRRYLRLDDDDKREAVSRLDLP